MTGTDIVMGEESPIEKIWVSRSGLICAVIYTRRSHRCGYVMVPQTHELYGKEYETVETEYDITVHGGLTFSSKDWIINGLWAFGFDCAHLGDAVSFLNGENAHLWSLEEVIIETELLADQLKSPRRAKP